MTKYNLFCAFLVLVFLCAGIISSAQSAMLCVGMDMKMGSKVTTSQTQDQAPAMPCHENIEDMGDVDDAGNTSDISASTFSSSPADQDNGCCKNCSDGLCFSKSFSLLSFESADYSMNDFTAPLYHAIFAGVVTGLSTPPPRA